MAGTVRKSCGVFIFMNFIFINFFYLQYSARKLNLSYCYIDDLISFYTKTIANKIFNCSSTLSDLDYHQFHNNPSQCECNTSSHLYQPYGHVINGDLSIIPNFKLRDLIVKGPKYREPCKVDWDKNLSLLCEAVDQYALQWAKREIAELSVLSSWKEMVKGQIEERISKLKLNFKQATGKVLENADVIFI